MISDEFKNIAYERSVLLFLRRTLQERLTQISSTTELIICEEVPYIDRIIPFESFDKVISQLDEKIDLLEKELGQFTHKREAPDGR